MNTGIVNDALLLCLNIYHSVPPNRKWAIVNIAKSPNATFTLTYYPDIPTSFGYNYDSVPDFLKAEGVIEASVEDHWYMTLGQRKSIEVFDYITIIAKSKKYFSNGEGAYYYGKWKTNHVDEGPKIPGQYSTLINMEKLSEFYNKYNPPQIADLPTFDNSKGILSFLGEKVGIEGTVNIKTMDLLVKNLNSRISPKEMYEVRDGSNYDVIVRQKGKTGINDIIKKVFMSLKSSVNENKKLANVIVFVQNDGFGIFIDRNALQLLTTPQQAPQKES